MSVIHTPRKPELDLRMLAFPGVVFVLLLLLFMRLWYFQIVKAPELVEKAENSRTIEVTSPAPRGLIYDRNGQLLAGVKPEIVITAVPSEIKKNPWVIEKVSEILKVPAKKLQSKLKAAQSRPYLPSPIFAGATIEQGTIISESRDDLPGINVVMQPMRYYPDGKSFTHVLGYVWTPNSDDVKRVEDMGKEPADYVGKTGIERAYEEALMGEPGSEKQEIDAKRRPVRVTERNSANPGSQLKLTIDSTLQKYATQYMATHYTWDGKLGLVGGVVALDPKTGEVLCLVSSPTFDQNLFSGGISDEEYQSVIGDSNKPMFDRAIHSSYSPGSVFKIITSLAAYRSHVFSPDNYYFCGGGVQVGNKFFKCLSYHGNIGYTEAMAKSCNSYFYQLGRAAGVDALRNACLEVGLGDKTGIDIGGEIRGVVPTEEWRLKHKKKWFTGDTMNFAIGQGYINATPLQLANLAALVANRGTNYQPHLVREVLSADGKGPSQPFEPKPLHHVDASTDFWDALQRALIAVLDHGTASYWGKIPGVVWAGKTGSVEHGDVTKGHTHAVFVGYAPANDPKIAICVLVENSGHGGDIAAPIARDIVQAYLKESDSKVLLKSSTAADASSANLAAPVVR